MLTKAIEEVTAFIFHSEPRASKLMAANSNPGLFNRASSITSLSKKIVFNTCISPQDSCDTRLYGQNQVLDRPKS